MSRIFVSGPSYGYAKWTGFKLTGRVEDANVAMLTGGTDVNPKLYASKPHPRTESPDTERDEREMAVIRKCIDLAIPIIGICRGAQLLCVAAGGKLVQHQADVHPHPMLIPNDQEPDRSIMVGGQHHQAQYPWGLERNDWRLFGFSSGVSEFHQDGDQKELPICHAFEVEMAYYRRVNGLAIQSHPEWAAFNSDEVEYCNLLVYKLMRCEL